MNAPNPPSVPDARAQATPNPDAQAGHEGTAIRLGGIMVFVVGLTVIVIVALFFLAALINNLGPAARPSEESYPGRATIEVDRFPEPRLQKDPRAELEAMRAEEEHRAATYGWVDRQAGTARIPIERALEILARSGLPRIAAPPPAPDAPPNTRIPPAGNRDKPADQGMKAPPVPATSPAATPNGSNDRKGGP